MRLLHDLENAFSGPQRVVDRARACRCGCEGQGSQHRASYRRTLHGVRRGEPGVVGHATTRWGADVEVVACATFRHPGLGERPCGLRRLHPWTVRGADSYQWVSLETGEERAARLAAETVESSRVSRELAEMLDGVGE